MDESLIHFFVNERKGDVSIKDSYGSTPLHYAASKSNVTAIKELLNSDGINVDVSFSGHVHVSFFMFCNLIDKCGRRLLGFRVLELISFDSLGHLACKTQPLVSIKFYVTESSKLLCVYILHTDRRQMPVDPHLSIVLLLKVM